MMAKKSVREGYLPLSSNPAIQQETMKALGIDGRTAEQRFIDEINEERKDNPIMNLQLNDGSRTGT